VSEREAQSVPDGIPMRSRPRCRLPERALGFRGDRFLFFLSS
jgi:hypothetical protein